jgi:predicted  nucleic acid-binding Zn-ribbon protein
MAINRSGTSVASEERAGQIQLATQAEVNAGVIDNKAVSPLTLQGKVGDVQTDITALEDRVEDLENGIAVPPGTPSQVEVDATQTGAGLNADGSYTAPNGSNYLGAATSLKSADSLLDSQIKTNADAIANLGNGNIAAIQTEVDEIESSVGLDADGGFTAAGGTNYLGAATSVRGEIVALDTQLGTVSASLANKVEQADINTAIANVIDAAPGALDTLNELAAAIGDDANFAGTITTSIAAVQSELDASQTGVGLNANGTYTAIAGTYATDATLKGAVTSLDTQLASTQSDLDTAEASLATAQGDISDLETLADTHETSIGLNADGSYTAIAGANYASGASLKTAVGQLDTQLKSTQDDLDTLETTVGNLQVGAPNQAEVDAIEAAVGLNANGSYAAHNGSNYMDTATTVKEALTDLDDQIKLNEDAAAANTTAIAGKASSADLTALQGEVDATQAAVGLNINGTFTAQAGTYINGASSVRQETAALDTQLASTQSELDATQTSAGLGANGSLPAYSDSTRLGGAAVSHHAALGSLSAELNSEISSRASGDSALNTLADTHEASIGLDADGGFTADATGNYISGATTVRGEISALDTQLKSTQDDLDTLETTVGNLQVGAPNQAEVDAIEAAVGLNANGSYSAHTTSNYLNAATSTKGALGLLDAEIRSNELDIATLSTAITTANNTNTTQSTEIVGLQTELDNTQAGAGLSAAGNYVAPGASNYLGTATSLKSADNLLDAEIKDNADDISTNTTNIATNATAIATKAAAADVTALETLADTHEASIGLTAAGAYQAPAGSNYLAAASSVRDADSKLDAQIKTNADNISTNTSDIGTNLAAIQSNDGDITALQGRMTTAETDITSLEGDMSTAQTDITNIQTLNTTQTTNISNLQTEVDAIEAGAGLSAAGAYSAPAGSNYLGAASSLKDADSKLDAQIKTNADNIASNDTDITALQGRMTTAESDIDDLESDVAQLQTDIANVPTSNNLTSLNNEVDAIETAVGLNANGTKSNFTSTNFVTATSSFKVAIEELDTDVNTAINNEASTRATADTALQTLIDTHETSLGLNADGSRPAYSSTNYASGTHNAAIGALDSQVKTNADAIGSNDTDITALQGRMTTAESDITSLEGDVSTLQTSVAAKASQTEMDATQSGVGLNADGSYTAIAGTYATDNTLKGAVTSLDTQLASTQSDLDTAETTIASQGTLLDTHESSIGLSAAGAHVQRSGSNYLDAATSIAGEIGILDGQVKTNETDIASLETLADTHETAIGLNANGTYSAPAGSNYIGASASLRAALIALDTRAKTNADDISNLGSGNITNLQNELDATQTGAGLNANGSYTADGSSNYISGVSTLKAADSALDSQIKTNADAIASNDTDIATNVTNIATNVSAINTVEASVGLNANGSYSAHSGSNYLDGATTVKGALTLADSQIKTNADAISSNDTDISNLQTLANTHESSIGLEADGSYNAIAGATYADSAASLKAAVAQLDTQLASTQSDLDTEESTRASEVAALDTRLDAREERGGGIFAVAGSDFEFADDFMIKGHAGCWAYHVNYGAAGVTKDIEFYQAAPAQSTKMLKILAGGDAEFAG